MEHYQRMTVGWWVSVLDESLSPSAYVVLSKSRHISLNRNHRGLMGVYKMPHRQRASYRVVRGDKVGGRRRDRVERVLALDGRHAETVHRHAVGLVGRH